MSGAISVWGILTLDSRIQFPLPRPQAEERILKGRIPLAGFRGSEPFSACGTGAERCL